MRFELPDLLRRPRTWLIAGALLALVVGIPLAVPSVLSSASYHGPVLSLASLKADEEVTGLLPHGPTTINLVQQTKSSTLAISGYLNSAPGPSSCSFSLRAELSTHAAGSSTTSATASYELAKAPAGPALIRLVKATGYFNTLAAPVGAWAPYGPASPALDQMASANLPGFGFLPGALTPSTGSGPCNLASLALFAKIDHKTSTLVVDQAKLTSLERLQLLNLWNKALSTSSLDAGTKNSLLAKISTLASIQSAALASAGQALHGAHLSAYGSGGMLSLSSTNANLHLTWQDAAPQTVTAATAPTPAELLAKKLDALASPGSLSPAQLFALSPVS